MRHKLVRECSKFYTKHWKTQHYIFTRSTYTEQIIAMARQTNNYQYALDVFKKYKLLIK